MIMFGWHHRPDAHEHAMEYATRDDFQRIFTEDMSALHLLALLLTTDPARAEQCFVAGLEESIQGNPVFRQWARSWSMRAIIRNAIRVMSPIPGQAGPQALDNGQASSERDPWITSIMQLPPFERFVFVILVLEDHSESDCASLLGCTMQELSRARSRALAQIASARGAAISPGTAKAYPALAKC